MTPSPGAGVAGERVAARWLRRRGWKIIDRNKLVGRDEIDIVAESPDGRTVAFIEVKSSRRSRSIRPERVDGAKRDRLRRSAGRLAGRFPDRWVRIDVITVELPRWRLPHVRHYVNVVQARDAHASGRSRAGCSSGGGSPVM